MSKLNNELANSIATVSEGGIEMIHHKYFVGIWSNHEMVISQANKVYDFKKPFDVRYKPIKKSKKIKSFSKQIKLEEDRLNNDKVRKEVDEYYKSVCTYIKDPQYNKAFFVKNDPFFKPFWEHPFWWEVYELVR